MFLLCILVFFLSFFFNNIGVKKKNQTQRKQYHDNFGCSTHAVLSCPKIPNLEQKRGLIHLKVQGRHQLTQSQVELASFLLLDEKRGGGGMGLSSIFLSKD